MTAIAIVGAGSWGQEWVRTLSTMHDAQLRWVCDSDPAALDAVQTLRPEVCVSESFADILADAYVEAVVLAVPAAAHFSFAKQALLAGKHVLVEKPITLTVPEAVELTLLSRRLRRTLMVGHTLEYHPAIAHLRSMIARNELGDVRHIDSTRLQWGKGRSDENAWWSLAAHEIAVAVRLMGTHPIAVYCSGQSLVRPGIVDMVHATLEFPGGRQAQMHVSWVNPEEVRKLTVIGTRRSVVFDDALDDGKLTVHDSPLRTGPIGLAKGDPVTPKLDTSDALMLEARHFIGCIRGQRQPLTDGEAGTTVTAVLEYGQRSLEIGHRVSIPSLDFVRMQAARRAA